MSPVWPLWFPFDSFHYNRGWFSTAEFSSVQQCTGGVPADGNCLIGFVWLSSTVSFQMCSQMACLGGCIALHTHIRFFFHSVFSNVLSNDVPQRMHCNTYSHVLQVLDFSPLCVVQQSGGVAAGGNWLIGRPGASTSPPPAPLPASCSSEKLNLSWLSVSLYPSILYPIHWLAMSRVFLKICGTQKIWVCACNLCVFAHEDGTCEVMKFITDATVWKSWIVQNLFLAQMSWLCVTCYLSLHTSWKSFPCFQDFWNPERGRSLHVSLSLLLNI